MAPASQRAEGVGDGAAGVVVAVELDVAVHDAAQRAHELVHLQRIGDAHGVGDADAIDADLVDRAIDRQQVDQVAAEAVLAAEAHFQPTALDELDHFLRRFDDVLDVFAVRKLAQIAAGAEHDVDAVDAGVHRHARVAHVTAHVGENLGVEAKAGDTLDVGAALGAGGGRCELQVLHAKRVQKFGDLHLLVGVEEGVGELLALSQR